MKPASLADYKAKLAAFWAACDPATVRAAARHLCRTDLYYLLRYALGRADIEHQWLFERCLEVQAEPDGCLDLWSREHYKSAIITYAKTIQDVLASHGDNPLPAWGGREVTVGLFSHSRAIAARFLRQIKMEFEQNRKLLELFPDVLYANPQRESPKWSEADGIVVRRKSNPAEATIEAWGVVDGQPIGKHFFILVYDDVVTPENVTTPDMLAKTSDMLSLSYALGAEGGRRRMIGTRYHANDAYQTVISRGTAKPRIHLLTQDGTATGEPTLRSREWVEDKRRDMGPYLFAAQMLQNPLADETQGFRDEWLQYHEGFGKPGGPMRAGLNVYLMFDPAGSKGKKSDYTSAWAVGLGPDKNLYVLDLVRDRLNLTQRASLVMRWHRKWRPMRHFGVRYERFGMMADIEHIKDLQARENYRFEVTEVKSQLPKNDRIKRLIPYFEQGRVWLPRTLWYTPSDGRTSDLIEDFKQQEYRAFPVPMHDDMLDALAQLVDPELPVIWPDDVGASASYEPAYSGE